MLNMIAPFVASLNVLSLRHCLRARPEPNWSTIRERCDFEHSFYGMFLACQLLVIAVLLRVGLAHVGFHCQGSLANSCTFALTFLLNWSRRQTHSSQISHVGRFVPGCFSLRGSVLGLGSLASCVSRSPYGDAHGDHLYAVKKWHS